MSIKVYTPEVKLSGLATVERVCSNCNKPWTEKIEIKTSAKGNGSWFGPDQMEMNRVKEKAHRDLKAAEESAKKQVDNHVLCPSCGHFSTDAMAKHFPKGYQAGLGIKYKKALLYAIIFMPIFGLGAVLLGQLVINASPKDWKDAWFLIIPCAILALLLAWGSIDKLVNGFRLLVGQNQVRKYLENENDEGLLNLAVSLYRKNKDSLGGFMCWAKMLLDRSKPK